MLTFAAATGAVAVVASQHEVGTTLPEVLLLLACVVAGRSLVAAEACSMQASGQGPLSSAVHSKTAA